MLNINRNKCDNAPYCGAKKFCPGKVISYEDNQIKIDNTKCIKCPICTAVNACPHRALSYSN